MISRLKQKVKNMLYLSKKDVKHFKKGINCKATWYGNKYAGFYVCPDLLNKNSIVYSFGIGEDISFDKEIIENHGCISYGFDPTPKSINWLKEKTLPSNFHFQPFGIGNKTELTNFYLPTNEDHVSGSALGHNNVNKKNTVQVQMKSLGDITTNLNHKHIDVLKMDIEGSEYDVIENILNTNVVIDQLLIEFHDRFFDKNTVKSIETVKLLQNNGYEIFAVSDSYEEISFVRKQVLSK